VIARRTGEPTSRQPVADVPPPDRTMAADRPTRASPRGTDPIITLSDVPSTTAERRIVRGPAALLQAYDGPLEIDLAPDRPVVIANFVSTLDGVVAMDIEGATGGGDVSGFSPRDRFVMGLLRAVADTIVVGAGTVRPSRSRAWTPGDVSPEHAADFAALRVDLGLAPRATVVIVTESGDLDPRHPALADPAGPTIIAGPDRAITRLRSVGRWSGIDLRVMSDLAATLEGVGGRVTLYEGGPRLFGALLERGLVDELFLTLAPQLAGRSAVQPRLSLVE
jgi:riboflavin biosynthesis pyrimidine reductase